MWLQIPRDSTKFKETSSGISLNWPMCGLESDDPIVCHDLKTV